MPLLNLITGQTASAPHISTEKSDLSAPKSAPPPTKNRVWKGPRALPARLAHEAEAPIFVLWRYGSTPNGRGKYPKLPFSPHKVAAPETRRGYTYRSAQTDEPASWATFAECLAAAADWRGWFDGIGRVLQPGEIGIDYDDCYDAGGTLAPFVAVDLAEASGYKERSVSLTGAHIIVEGHIQEAIKTDAIELYPGGSGRFFVLTGDELHGSSRPAPAQALIERLVKTYGNARARSGQQAAAPRQVETVALTPELASDVAEAEANLAELLQSLRDNMTSQLFNLLMRGIYPPALKDTSASGARAVVVAQLQRAPRRRYSDAEVYVLARELWRRKAYEGAIAGNERKLSSDCRRLMADYRPGAPARAKRTYNPAPEPLAYLARMAEAATSGAVLLNRDERARLASVPRATAQRIELRLVEMELAELAIYNLTGPASKGRRGMLRVTPEGYLALGRHNESVILTTPAQDEPVSASALESAKPIPAPDNNTLLCDGAVLAGAPAHTNPRVLPTSDEPPALSLAELVADAVAAYGTSYQFGQAKPLERVLAYVQANSGGRTWPAAAVETLYRQELERRERARDEARIAAMDIKALAKAQKSASNAIARALAPKPQPRGAECDEPEERYLARVEAWRKARRALAYWRWYHGFVSEVLSRKRAEMTARIALAPAPLLDLLDELEAAPEPGSQGYSVEGVQYANGQIGWRLYDDATDALLGEFHTEQDAERYVANGWPAFHTAARERALTLTA